MKLITSLLLTLITAQWTSQPVKTVAKEYCQFEAFDASCPANQIILMEEAKYGRLEIGRCVTHDYGYIGCSADVLHLLDRSCSGQRSCQFGVPKLRELVQPCPRDLTSYLEATYRCLTIIDYSSLKCNTTFRWRQEEDSSSSSSAPPPPPSPPPPPASGAYAVGLLSPDRVSVLTTANRPSAGVNCGVVFAAEGGQRIRLTMYDLQQRHRHRQAYAGAPGAFAPAKGPSFPPQFPSPCIGRDRHGRLTKTNDDDDDDDDEDDEDDDENEVVTKRRCRLLLLHGAREQPLATTNGTQATLFLSNGFQKMASVATTGHKWNYILMLEVTGCADPKIPVDVRIERVGGGRLVVHCNRTRESWHLTCKGTRWIGLMPNCSNDVLRRGGDARRLKTFPLGILGAIAIGVLLGIFFGLPLLFFLIYRRRRKRNPMKCLKSTVLLENEDIDYLDVEYGVRSTKPRPPESKISSHRKGQRWLRLIPSSMLTPNGSLPSGTMPPPLLEMRCWSKNESVETTFVVSSHSVMDNSPECERIPRLISSCPSGSSLGRSCCTCRHAHHSNIAAPPFCFTHQYQTFKQPSFASHGRPRSFSIGQTDRSTPVIGQQTYGDHAQNAAASQRREIDGVERAFQPINDSSAQLGNMPISKNSHSQSDVMGDQSPYVFPAVSAQFQNSETPGHRELTSKGPATIGTTAVVGRRTIVSAATLSDLSSICFLKTTLKTGAKGVGFVFDSCPDIVQKDTLD